MRNEQRHVRKYKVHPFFIFTSAVFPALVVFGAGFANTVAANAALAIVYYLISVKVMRWVVR